MAICRQACPYNTLDGCKVKAYGGVCPLTNTAQPFTEYVKTAFAATANERTVMGMAGYKCGDCFHADLCEESKMLIGFSRDNPAYCGMFLNCADVAPVRHGSIIETIGDGRMKRVFSCCGKDFTELTCWMTPNYCPNCGAKIDKKKEDK